MWTSASPIPAEEWKVAGGAEAEEGGGLVAVAGAATLEGIDTAEGRYVAGRVVIFLRIVLLIKAKLVLL